VHLATGAQGDARTALTARAFQLRVEGLALSFGHVLRHQQVDDVQEAGG